MDLFGSFVIACSMYSRIPMPQVDWTENRMKYAMCFFPVIGAVIGGLLYLWIYLTGDSTGSLFRAAVAVLIPIIITGGIHLDGLLDTADALSSYKSMEEKLEILKDSHTGAFAIIVGGGLFGLPGMILGVPVFAIIYAYTSGAINSKLREKEMPTDTLVYEDFSKYRIDKEEVFGKERFEAARRVGEHDTEAARRE